MSKVSKLHLSKQHNIQINTCRLYLQVVILSDIANSDGRTVNNHFLDENKPIDPKSNYMLRTPTTPITPTRT